VRIRELAADNSIALEVVPPSLLALPHHLAPTDRHHMEGTMIRRVLLITLAACALTATVALAQSNLGFKRVGAAVGFVNPENVDGTFSLGVFADHGTLAPRIGLESRIDWWSQSEGAFGAEASVRDLAIGARGKYYFPVSRSKVRPFAGAGLGLHFVHAEVTIPAQFGFPETQVEDSSTKLGLDLGGGMATPVGPRTDFHAELWFGIVSDVDQFALRVGLSQKVGP
jgi:outer membrane protein W